MKTLAVLFFLLAGVLIILGILAFFGKIKKQKIRNSSDWLIISGSIFLICGHVAMSNSPTALILITSSAILINLIIIISKNEGGDSA